jgi:hypothetical protein
MFACAPTNNLLRFSIQGFDELPGRQRDLGLDEGHSVFVVYGGCDPCNLFVLCLIGEVRAGRELGAYHLLSTSEIRSWECETKRFVAYEDGGREQDFVVGGGHADAG